MTKTSTRLPVITVDGVSKRYRLYSRPIDRIIEFVTGRARHQPYWGLRDVSFSIGSGEIVGIVGRNGAGKSTLLRLLTGISTPTSGEITIRARMSAILELGSGFHPELSGRENVYLGGAVLGMSTADVEARYDGIVDFAELGPYMDMPFKTYSLGMQARLSFSVASCIDPEIMIIDEALGAGDGAFIAKCFERIRQICAGGATVVFVSHNTYLVQRLCQRALWIDQGRLVADGVPATVCRDYESLLRSISQDEAMARNRAAMSRFEDADSKAVDLAPLSRISHRWGTGEVRITAFQVLDGDNRPLTSVFSHQQVRLRLEYQGDTDDRDLAFVVTIVREDGVVAATFDNREAGISIGPVHGSGIVELDLGPLLLGKGRYLFSPHIYRDLHGVVRTEDVLDYHDRLYELTVSRSGRPYDVAIEHPVTWHHSLGNQPE